MTPPLPPEPEPLLLLSSLQDIISASSETSESSSASSSSTRFRYSVMELGAADVIGTRLVGRRGLKDLTTVPFPALWWLIKLGLAVPPPTALEALEVLFSFLPLLEMV